MKIKINYFTSTGNTLWMAEKLKENFEKLGAEVMLYDSVTCGNECFEDCDMVGFAYPVWGSTMPNLQREILNRMNDGKGKKVFFIGNAGMFCGDTGIYYKKIADSKGYDTVYVDHVYLPINVKMPGFNFGKIPDGSKKEKMAEKASKKLDIICTNIISGKRKFAGRNILSVIGGRGQRNNYDPIVDKMKAQMFIDNEKCIKCNLCYKICPMGAIEKTDNDTLKIDTDKCIFCLKCYNYCPKGCALKGAGSADTEKYTRYKGLNKGHKPIEYR